MKTTQRVIQYSQGSPPKQKKTSVIGDTMTLSWIAGWLSSKLIYKFDTISIKKTVKIQQNSSKVQLEDYIWENSQKKY